MDNVQKVNNYINVSLSQLLYCIHYNVLWGMFCLCILDSADFVAISSVNLHGSFQFENLITGLVKYVCLAIL
jgi:hypothetical protein